MSILTDAQIAQFDAQGFLLVSGLMGDGVAERAAAAIWRSLDASPDEPSTWEGKGGGKGLRDPEVLACFTPEMARAADQLSHEPHPDWNPPASAFALNTFPQSGVWAPHGPHIDHAIKADGFHTFPRPMRLASLLYLTDVAPDSGGTVVWPGSHKTILARAESDPEKYALMWTLNQEIPAMELGEGQQVLSRAGDILFYHYLCAHSGSNNVGTRPRFALAHKW